MTCPNMIWHIVLVSQTTPLVELNLAQNAHENKHSKLHHNLKAEERRFLSTKHQYS